MASSMCYSAVVIACAFHVVVGTACSGASCDATAPDDPSLLQTVSQHGPRRQQKRQQKKRTPTERRKPHIVFVVADDLGWTGLGYNAKLSVQEIDPALRVFEAEVNFTPNLDKMATKEGVVLRRHYAYTSCTPSRQAFMTGRLPVRVGVLLRDVWAWDGGVNKTWGYEGLPIPPNASSIARKFKDVGYYSAAIGKMDGHGVGTPEHTPVGRGFDESLNMFHHGTDNWNYRATLGGAGEVPPCIGEQLKGVLDFWDSDKGYANATELAKQATPLKGEGVHKEVIYLDRAVSIIKEHAAKRRHQSLFLWFASTLAHTPLQAPKKYIASIAQMMCDWSSDCLTDEGKCSLLADEGDEGSSAVGVCGLAERRDYLAMISMLDDHVGVLRKALEEVNMWQDTVLVYASDNGGGIGVGAGANNWPLHGGKGSDWEGGSRTPAFVSGGFLPKDVWGTQMNQVMHIMDWYGTFLSLAEADWKTDNLDDVIGPVDAKDFWNNIVGKGRKENHDELHLSPWCLIQKQENGHWLKIMTETQGYDMKTGPEYPNNTDAARPLNPAPIGPTPLPKDCGEGCLFDLDDDPREYVNLNSTDQYGTQLRAMAARLEQLNEEQYTEPWRGCIVDTFSCAAARHQWGSFYGPYLNVPNCPTCVNDAYFKRCGGGAELIQDQDKIFACVPRSTNDCNCITQQSECENVRHTHCEWKDGVCDLTAQFQGVPYKNVVLKVARSGITSFNSALGATRDS